MKNNLTTNEFYSFDSTIESPSKPNQEKIKENCKNIFLVHYMNESNIPKNNYPKRRSKHKKRNNSLKNKKHNTNDNSIITPQEDKEYHTLDFDLILKIIIDQKKNTTTPPSLKKSNYNSKKKLLTNKRKRNLSSKGNLIHQSKLFLIYNNKDSNNLNGHYDIYDLNNFCSNTVKIKEKSISYLVQCPTYEELNDDFFEDNNIVVSFFIINFFIGF